MLEPSYEVFKQEKRMAQDRAGVVGMESIDRMQETLVRTNWLIEQQGDEEAGMKGDSWISSFGDWH